MLQRRAKVTRILLSTIVLVVGAGTAVATADEAPVSPPAQYRASSGSSNLAADGFTGAGVTVAVIDTGVADVPGMHGKVIHQVNLSSAPDAGDQYGHGTFVAGVVHAAAPEAEIVSIKLSDANGSVDVTQVLAALQWVIANKERFSIDVVNLSFGNDSKQSAHVSPLNYAVQQVWDNGIVVVASAGNLGDGAGTVTKPADDPLIISVGATSENGTPDRSDDDIPSFVSRGPTQDGLAKPDLVAPGTRLVSLRAPGSTVDVANPQARVGEDGFRGSGTSFAAPLVTGVVAQVLGADPTLTPDQVKHGLLHGAQAVHGDPAAQGAGTVRATRTLRLAREGRANANVQRSSGTGSLDGARGSATVKVATQVRTLTGGAQDVSIPVVGERTAEVPPTLADAPLVGLVVDVLDLSTEALDPYRGSEFLDHGTWDASSWGASSWGASQWGASSWGASHWGASSWGASSWGSSQWWASSWG